MTVLASLIFTSDVNIYIIIGLLFQACVLVGIYNIMYHKSECYMFRSYVNSTNIYCIIGPSSPKVLTITRELQYGLELNWLPPTEPNGEVHYVIYYTPEGGTEQSIDTGSDLTHYNLTGLERNRVYTNIAVQAVNSAGRSDRGEVIAQYNHTPSSEFA